MSTQSIKDQAAAFTKSYGAAVALGHTKPGSTTLEIAEAVAGHYHPQLFTVFTQTTVTAYNSSAEGISSVKEHYDRFEANGLGLDIRMDKFRVETVSPLNALCFITWSVHPPASDGIESWSWENVYSYRIPVGQETGSWDFTIADNELAGLVQHVPGFFG